MDTSPPSPSASSSSNPSSCGGCGARCGRVREKGAHAPAGAGGAGKEYAKWDGEGEADDERGGDGGAGDRGFLADAEHSGPHRPPLDSWGSSFSSPAS